jgi:murein DD-endopeptidase MepM/ murein hydrolase activator NlpD
MKNFILSIITLLIIGSPLRAQEAVRLVRPVADSIQINGSYLFGETSSANGTQTGVDFLTSDTDTVYAAHPGTVGIVDEDTFDGIFIVLDGTWKDEKINTYYGYLSKPLVTQGEEVAAGDAIAIAGSSGDVSGPRTHFEVRYGWHSSEAELDNSRMNPELWVAMEGTGTIVGTVPDATSETRVDIDPDPKLRPPYTTYGWSLTYDFTSSKIGSDPFYNENYAIGEVKPGTYSIISGSYSKTVTVKAGEITSVEGIVVTSNEEEEISIAKDIQLNQNYPNPFNPSTVINFSIPNNSFVTLAVYNMLGRQVALLRNQRMSAGTHDVTFNASNLSSGIYIYRLTAGQQTLTRKLTLVK